MKGHSSPEDKALDSHRLPRTVIPTRYDLRLTPDLTTFTFDGEETIAVTVTEPTAEVWLNAAELAISEATIGRDGGPVDPGTVSLEEERERCCLRFSETIAPGTWRLRLVFRGTLNDKLRGFYRSTYKDQTGATRTLAATQFEATDARRAFPCWDEPAFKAVFSTTLVIDPALTAVSNSTIVSERLEGGKKVVAFADTITMSTYLVAFVVGELEATDPVMVARTPLRVWCVPGKRRLAAFGRDIGAASLAFFEAYYGLPYAGDKLDLLAIPDFAAGAMENFGAITFRETALLVDETAATHGELERIADVVAHENAHMWFGDLVTMAWWNGIWLNEAFATFMEMLAVDAWRPEWQRWTTFGVSRSAAFAVDGLHSTRPIEFPVGRPARGRRDVRRPHLREGRGRPAHARAVPRPGRLSRGRARVSAPSRLRQRGDRRSLGRAGTRLRRGHPGPDGRVDLPPRLSRSSARASRAANSCSTSSASRTCPSRSRACPAARGPGGRPRSALARAGAGPPETASARRGSSACSSPSARHGSRCRARSRQSWSTRAATASIACATAATSWTGSLRRLPEGLAPIERFNLVGDAWAATHGRTDADRGVPGPHRRIPRRARQERVGRPRGIAHRAQPDHPCHRPPGARAPGARPIGGLVEELGWEPRPGEDELRRQLRGDSISALGILGNDPADPGAGGGAVRGP